MKPTKIWTTLSILAENDDKEYQREYDTEVFRSGDHPCSIVELPVLDVSPRGIYVTVQAPPELGPVKRTIKLPFQEGDNLAFFRGAFATKEECLRGLVRLWACRMRTALDRIEEAIHMTPGPHLWVTGVSDADLEEADMFGYAATKDGYMMRFIIDTIRHDRAVKQHAEATAAAPKEQPKEKPEEIAFDEAVKNLNEKHGFLYADTRDKTHRKVLYRINRSRTGKTTVYATWKHLIDDTGIVWIRMGYPTKRIKKISKWSLKIPENWLKLNGKAEEWTHT